MCRNVQGNVSAAVNDVRKTQDYVLHSVILHSGTVRVGDTVMLLVDKVPSHATVLILIMSSQSLDRFSALYAARCQLLSLSDSCGTYV